MLRDVRKARCPVSDAFAAESIVDDDVSVRESVQPIGLSPRRPSATRKAPRTIPQPMVGESPAFAALMKRVAMVAPTDATVLILGETGTGKERVAQAIHARSPRFGRPLVSINCAAVQPSLIASELFVHERGAFTGSLRQRVGRFELA